MNRFCWVKGVIAAYTGEKWMLLCQCQVSSHLVSMQRETHKWCCLCSEGLCQLSIPACQGYNDRPWDEKKIIISLYLLHSGPVLCICDFSPIYIWMRVFAILNAKEGIFAIFGAEKIYSVSLLARGKKIWDISELVHQWPSQFWLYLFPSHLLPVSLFPLSFRDNAKCYHRKGFRGVITIWRTVGRDREV